VMMPQHPYQEVGRSRTLGWNSDTLRACNTHLNNLVIHCAPKRPGPASLHEVEPSRRQGRLQILRPGRLGTLVIQVE